MRPERPRDETNRVLKFYGSSIGMLGRFDGYVGISHAWVAALRATPRAMGWVMDDLKERLSLMFLDSRTIATSIGAKAASAAGVPFAERDVFLDDDQSARRQCSSA